MTSKCRALTNLNELLNKKNQILTTAKFTKNFNINRFATKTIRIKFHKTNDNLNKTIYNVCNQKNSKLSISCSNCEILNKRKNIKSNFSDISTLNSNYLITRSMSSDSIGNLCYLFNLKLFYNKFNEILLMKNLIVLK